MYWGGLLAAVFGLIDWLHIPASMRAKSVGMWHGIGNVVVTLFALSWWLRSSNPANLPSTLAFLLALVNAPNSLSGVPADANLHGVGRT